MFLIGVIWALLAPLSLVIGIIVVAFLFRRHGKTLALCIGSAVVLIPSTLIYAKDRTEFSAICDKRTGTTIYKKAETEADGILLTSETASSFGMRYIRSEGFTWLETYKTRTRDDGWVRVELGPDGSTITTKILEPTARYEVKDTYEKVSSHTTINTITITERSTGDVLASSARGDFDGGHMKWFLGALSAADCPSITLSDSIFTQHYHLARNTLIHAE